MPHHPLVTIITPTYNAAAYLPATIQSVFAQTYPHWEWIIIDDESTDDTRTLIAKLSDSRIRIIHRQHCGMPGAVRNTGLAQARGTYIAFLDADDTWLPRKLDLQVAYLQTHPTAGLVYSQYYEWPGQEEANGRLVPDLRGLPNPGMVLPDLCLRFFIGTSSVMLHRWLLEQFGGFDETLNVAEDYELWLRLAPHTEYGFVKRPLMRHRVHTGGLTHNPVSTIQQWIEARQRARKRNPAMESLLHPLRLKLPAKSLMELGRAELLQGLPGSGRQHLLQSLRIYPLRLDTWKWLALSYLGRERALKLRKLVLRER